MDCSLPDSSVRGIFQARILEWVAISSSRASSPLRDRTHVSWPADSLPLNHQGSLRPLRYRGQSQHGPSLQASILENGASGRLRLRAEPPSRSHSTAVAKTGLEPESPSSAMVEQSQALRADHPPPHPTPSIPVLLGYPSQIALHVCRRLAPSQTQHSSCSAGPADSRERRGNGAHPPQHLHRKPKPRMVSLPA